MRNKKECSHPETVFCGHNLCDWTPQWKCKVCGRVISDVEYKRLREPKGEKDE